MALIKLENTCKVRTLIVCFLPLFVKKAILHWISSLNLHVALAARGTGLPLTWVAGTPFPSTKDVKMKSTQYDQNFIVSKKPLQEGN